MTYSFWHSPKIRSIRNGGYERHDITLDAAQNEFAKFLAFYAQQEQAKDFRVQEIEVPEHLQAVVVRQAAILHKRTNRLWYRLQITAR